MIIKVSQAELLRLHNEMHRYRTTHWLESSGKRWVLWVWRRKLGRHERYAVPASLVQITEQGAEINRAA